MYLNAGENLQVVLDRVEKNGGQIILPKTAHADESGYFAIFLDSEGNKMALNSPKLTEKEKSNRMTAILRQARFCASFDAFCVYLCSVLRIKCCVKKPARTPSPKTLFVILKNVNCQKNGSSYKRIFKS
jgi:hypothetical protein